MEVAGSARCPGKTLVNLVQCVPPDGSNDNAVHVVPVVLSTIPRP
jgi:hypothetical protein